MMNIKTWTIRLLSAICLSFIGIINLFEKKTFLGILFLALGVLYLILSIYNYKNRNKSKKIILSDIDKNKMDIELKKLIAEGKKVEAIKKYRIITGLGLLEGKEYVDLLSEKTK